MRENFFFFNANFVTWFLKNQEFSGRHKWTVPLDIKLCLFCKLHNTIAQSGIHSHSKIQLTNILPIKKRHSAHIHIHRTMLKRNTYIALQHHMIDPICFIKLIKSQWIALLYWRRKSPHNEYDSMKYEHTKKRIDFEYRDLSHFQGCRHQTWRWMHVSERNKRHESEQLMILLNV